VLPIVRDADIYDLTLNDRSIIGSHDIAYRILNSNRRAELCWITPRRFPDGRSTVIVRSARYAILRADPESSLFEERLPQNIPPTGVSPECPLAV
jgi:hypothetical protein